MLRRKKNTTKKTPQHLNIDVLQQSTVQELTRKGRHFYFKARVISLTHPNTHLGDQVCTWAGQCCLQGQAGQGILAVSPQQVSRAREVLAKICSSSHGLLCSLEVNSNSIPLSLQLLTLLSPSGFTHQLLSP